MKQSVPQLCSPQSSCDSLKFSRSEVVFLANLAVCKNGCDFNFAHPIRLFDGAAEKIAIVVNATFCYNNAACHYCFPIGEDATDG